MKRLLPLAAVERLVKKAGAERASREAVEVLASILEDYAESVAQSSVKYARYAGRTTVKREDIELAASE